MIVLGLLLGDLHTLLCLESVYFFYFQPALIACPRLRLVQANRHASSKKNLKREGEREREGIAGKEGATMCHNVL